MYQEHLSKKLTEHIANEFDKLKDKYNMTYEKDFEPFSLGYTMGVFGTLKNNIKNI